MQVNLLNPFLVHVPILCPLKTQKTRFYCVFRGIKWGHWPEMGQDSIYETVNKRCKSVTCFYATRTLVLLGESLSSIW